MQWFSIPISQYRFFQYFRMPLEEAASQFTTIFPQGDQIYISQARSSKKYYKRVSKKLEEILQESLCISLSGLALRTRSKVVKTEVCKAIGYPVPGSFKRTQPRFPGQNFDVYIQKSNNLQIWNEELDASRRYVIVRVDEDNRIGNVRVISGAELAKLDRTGTLTQKYQATLDVARFLFKHSIWCRGM